MPRSTRKDLELKARLSPRARLYSLVPRSSQCPSMTTRALGFSLSHAAFARKISWASTDRLALSNSKRISSFSNISLALWILSLSSLSCSSLSSSSRMAACLSCSLFLASSSALLRASSSDITGSDSICFLPHEGAKKPTKIIRTRTRNVQFL